MSKHKVEIISRGVMISGGKLLVCHTKGASNTYLPGGHVDFGENAKSALKREIDEEMDATAVVGKFLGTCEHAFVQEGKRKSEVNLVFEMEVEGLNPDAEPESAEEYIEFMWIDFKGLKDSNLEPAILRSCLPEWISKCSDIERWVSNIST